MTRTRTAPYRDVQRAKIVLAAADGMSNAGIALLSSIRRDRFVAQGTTGLVDRPRTGRPAVYGPDVHICIVAAATGELPEADSQWSHRLLAEHLADDGICASRSDGSWPTSTSNLTEYAAG